MQDSLRSQSAQLDIDQNQHIARIQRGERACSSQLLTGFVSFRDGDDRRELRVWCYTDSDVVTHILGGNERCCARVQRLYLNASSPSVVKRVRLRRSVLVRNPLVCNCHYKGSMMQR